MKKILYMSLTVAALVFSLNLSATDYETTDKVIKHSFHRAKNIHRFERQDGYVEYDFMMKGRYVSAYCTPDGNLVETDYSISYVELPAKLIEFINAEFSTAVMTDIIKVQYRQSTWYKVRLESGNKEYKIVSTEAGEITMGYE